MPERIVFDHVAVVLNRPRIPENIGFAARAICNMGLKRLIVVNPPDFDLEKIKRTATHAAHQIVEKISVCENLKEALHSFNWVVGTTARLGGQRKAVGNPSQLARKLIPISRDNKIALLFGPEDRGLTNEDIRLCHDLVNIPTADFSSLNLAQAVMIMAYEIHIAGRSGAKKETPRLAGRYELDGMYEQLKEILIRIDYIKPDHPDYWMGKVYRFFNRLRLRAGEVSIIRGICRQIDWYGKKCFQDGRNHRERI